MTFPMLMLVLCLLAILLAGFVAGFVFREMTHRLSLKKLSEKYQRSLERESRKDAEISSILAKIEGPDGYLQQLSNAINQHQTEENTLREEVRVARAQYKQSDEAFIRNHNQLLSVSANLADAKNELSIKGVAIRRLQDEINFLQKSRVNISED